MKGLREGVLALALVLLPQAGRAQDAGDADKYMYFSQPTASRAQVAADWDECRDLASAVQPPPAGYVYTPNLAAAGVNGLMQGFVRGAQRRHLSDAALRKCMSIKGYDRYAMTKDEAKATYKGSWPEMRERLVDRALAPTDGLMRLEP